jgi:hypothetical protein
LKKSLIEFHITPIGGDYWREAFMKYREEIAVIHGLAPAVDVERIPEYLE